MTLLVFYAIIKTSLTNLRRSKMSKYQARVYFLYPFLLAVFSLFLSDIILHHKFGIDGVLFFCLVTFLSGVISFTHERKNTLSEILSISGSVIIFSLIMVIGKDISPTFSLILDAILSSFLYHVLMFIFLVGFHGFFEWIFDVKKPETNLNN